MASNTAGECPQGNQGLAQGLRQRARGEGSVTGRAILLTASVALAETRSVAAAQRVLAEWDGPAAVRDGAIEVLGELGAMTGS